MRILLVTQFLSLVFFGLTQKATPISSENFIKEMNLVRKSINLENSKLVFKKSIYRDKQSMEIISEENGQYLRGVGSDYKLMTEGVLVIQTGKIKIMVDSTEEFVQLSHFDSLSFPGNEIVQIPTEYLAQFDLFKSSSATYAMYSMVPKEDGGEGMIDIYVDTKTSRLYRIDISFPKGNYFSEDLEDETEEEPLVSIVYEPIELLKQKLNLDFSSILIKEEKGNYRLNEQFSSFQFHDARIK